MRRRFTAFAAMLMIGAMVAPWASAQITDVTIREINFISPDSIQALNDAGVTLDDPRIENAIFNDLLRDTVRVRAVVMSDPTLSGLSTPNSEGLPSRVHFFVRDTASVTQGNAGMGLQIVDGSWQENGVLSLLVGDVIEIVGVVAPFDEVMQVAPVSITALGVYTDFGLPASILDPVVITTGDTHKVVGQDNRIQTNWDNLADLRGQYVRIENAIVQRRDISSDRPNWTFSSDAGVTQVYIRDLSLAYRNDRDGAQDATQFRVFEDDFVPPPPGAGINIQGFMFMDDFDPFAVGTDPDVLIKISPMEREDLEITVTPPIASNPSKPETVLGTEDSAVITADITPDPTRTLESVVLYYYTSSVPDTMSVEGSLSGKTQAAVYQFTIPPAADGDFVTYWIIATDNLGAESQPVNVSYRVLGSGITTIAHVQETADGGPGAGPFAGLTLPMNITATVVSQPDSSGLWAIQDDEGLAPWSGILLRDGDTNVQTLKQGDVINITEAEIEERFDVTRLRNITMTVTGTAVPPGYKSVPTSALVDESVAEAHEGMRLRFENVTIVSIESFGEWTFSSDGTAENAVNADDASDAFGSSFAGDTFAPDDAVAFIQGIWWFSFGEYKLVPESSLDIGGINVANEEFEVPGEFALGQNYPNPFNPSTTIQYNIPAASVVSVQVFDMLGRNVATLVDGQVAAGTHTVSFDARNLASGVYLYRLEAAGNVINRSMMLLK
ncbi:MAG: T9SS type A sorting domain-containing protein [Rhodothermales bacterium]|nr:T9SS type A sorting domain-containing protein [Rhodothermales bacterium]